MLQKYKEIFYGGLFGLGAGILDTVMDARMEGLSIGDEMVQHRPMLFYRTLFIFFGLALGWLLWQKNRRERDFRDLSEILKRFRQEYGGPAILMHAKLQVLLTRKDLHLPPEAEGLVRFVYEQSKKLESLVDKLPSW
jgi:hypothetical protein